MHIGHAGQEAAVHEGRHQQLEVFTVLGGRNRRHHGAGRHAADIDGLQDSVGGQADLVDNVVAGGAEHHFMVACANQCHHVNAHRVSDVGGEFVVANGFVGGRRVGVLLEQLGDAGVVLKDLADFVFDDFGRLLQPDPHVAVENLRQGGGGQFCGDHGRHNADQPKSQDQFALHRPARHFEWPWFARRFRRDGHYVSLIAAARAGSWRSGRMNSLTSLSTPLIKRLRWRKNSVLF